MKKKTKVILGVSAFILAGAGYGVYQILTPHETPVDQNASVQTNFYQAINKDWINQATIPSDKPAVAVFSEIQDDIDEKMKKDVTALVSGKESTDIRGMSEFIEFYQLVTDFDAREKLGIEPVKPYLQELEKLSSLKDLSDNIPERTLKGLSQPYSIYVGVDLKNTSKKVINLSAPSLFLLDSSYYQDEASKKQLEGLFKTAAVDVLKLLEYDEKEAEELVEGALAFDSKIAEHVPTAEEMSEIEATYHMKTADEVRAYSETFDFISAFNKLVGQEVREVNVPTPKFFEAFDELFTEKNFEDIKAWLIVSEAMADAPYLTDELRIASGSFNRAISGTAEPTSKEDDAFSLATSMFSSTFSTYYGQKYFGEDAKADVTGMIDDIVAVYKKRLSENDWLSDSTKAKAVEKLDSMVYYIGYPEEVSKEVDRIDIDPDKSMVDNIVQISENNISYSFERFNEPVDKSEWVASSYMVNAFYNPANNSITFPAAILNEPFYSPEQTDAQNYGAIGVVMGHEITHAFDSNGAKFDKEGNLSNWWTEADTKAFDNKTQAMDKLFDGIEIYGGKVNGKLTVTENTADAGGLSASLEALQTKQKDANLKEFFENYAKIWRQKASLEYNQLLLNLDVHAPAELRVNVQLKNMDAFYEAYDIKEDDPMFLPADQRVKIW